MQTFVGLFVAISLSQAVPAATTGRISGRVTVEGVDTPIQGARIMLFPVVRPSGPSGPIDIPQATTDQEGRFVLDRLAPGEYRIEVQKTGFAPLLGPGTRPPTIQVAAGQTVEAVHVQLQKGGVIAGKVLDPSGEPFTDGRIMTMRRTAGSSSGAAPRFMPTPAQGPQQTNDLGEFRVSGLAPGEYYVAAMPGPSTFGGPTTAVAPTGSARTVLATTFYPGTTDPAGAQPITVAAGTEVSSLVFTMQATPAFRVSGVVVDENGSPVPRAIVMLMVDPRSGMFLGPAGNTRTLDDGRFVIEDVPTGSYRVTATVPMTIGTAGANGGAVGGFVTFNSGGSTGGIEQPTEIVVADTDVNGVRVSVRRPPQ
jgi:hypothetical protein